MIEFSQACEAARGVAGMNSSFPTDAHVLMQWATEEIARINSRSDQNVESGRGGESLEQDVSDLLTVSKRALAALRFAARSEFLATLVRDLDQAIQNVEPWLDQATDDPIQNGWVDHRGMP